MTDCIAPHAAPVAAGILSSDDPCFIDRVPPELLPEILGYLDQADLRSAAAASRVFYDSAWRAGLYLHINIQWHDLHYNPDKLLTIKEVVDHIQRNSLRLSISAAFPTRGFPLEVTNFEITHDVLGVLSSALPVLVYLSVHTPVNFFPAVAAALRHPVPNLAIFDLSVNQMLDDPAAHRLPTDLFMGSAPKLCQLTLENVPLAHDPVSAFCSVDTLSFDYVDVYPDIEYARHFPNLQCLHLAFYTETMAAPPGSFRLDGVRLHKLTLGACSRTSLLPSALASTKLEDIHTVVLNGPFGDWTDPLWDREDNGPISVRLTCCLPKLQVWIVVVPKHRKWWRAYNSRTWSARDCFSVSGIPRLSESLAYLRMDNGYIASLLECNGLALRALRELRLDFQTRGNYATMVWPPDLLFSFAMHDMSAPTFSRPSYSYVECSALRRLTLFAMEAVLCVASSQVAYLGRALSQCARPKHDREELVLVGIKLNEDEHPLLEKAFSAVTHRAFAGSDSMAGRDAGLWGDDFD